MHSSLEALDWREFLARPMLAPHGALDALRGESILITGAGGSIGAALALRLGDLRPPRLALLDSSESHLFALERDWAAAAPDAHAAFILGSAGDARLLDEIFSLHAPRFVFHAAAYKHVPLLEEQPLAAIENNVFSTRTLVRAAAAHGAQVILLSTDKAVQPASILGVTKRVAEQMVLAAGGTALRLGNVLGSRDSVTEVFAGQIAAGGPLTVTGPAARRYFLTLGEAVGLLLAAAAEPEPPLLLAPAVLAPHFIADLASFMARKLAPQRKVPIVFIPARAGDKETERLWSRGETVRPASAEGLLSIESPPVAKDQLHRALDTLRAAVDDRDLPAAIAGLQTLVPDYTPGPAVLALAGRSAARLTTRVAP